MANLNRDFIIYIDSVGSVTYSYKNRTAVARPNQWPLLSVNTRSEAETLRVLFCQREFPCDNPKSRWFLPGFQGTEADLPFAANRLIDAYDQIRAQV